MTEEEKAYIMEKKKVNKELIKKITKQNKFRMNQDEIEENKIKNHIKSTNRAKSKVRRLIDTNINMHKVPDKFVTLTMKENEEDRQITNKDFKQFIQRLRYKYKSFQYIAVIEKQKRGAIHYHVIFFGLPYIKKNELQEIWRHGFVKINKIENYYNISKYLVKYMTKDIENGRVEDQKRYLVSRGLTKPQVLYNIDIEEMIENEYLQFQYSNQFEGEYVGQVICSTYLQI